MKVAAYARVSTTDQDCRSQRHAIDQWLAARPNYQATYFIDEGISGSTSKRPAFQQLIAAVAAGEFDVVVVYRLDRLSRDALTAVRLLMDWIQRDVEFFATEQPIFQLGKSNPFRLTFLSMFAELAQLEREGIVGRVKAGLTAAKARGVQLGKPSKLDMDLVKGLRAAGRSTRSIATQLGVSAATVSRALRR